MTVHLVQFSTGAGSAEVAFRVYAAAEPDDRVVLLTADTMAEDEDNWRFAYQCVEQMPGVQWLILADGRTPMQVGRDERCVPNNRMAVCSKHLKRRVLRQHIDGNYNPADSVIHMGFDWTEEHRLNEAVPHWAPWTVRAPLMAPPYLTKAQILDSLRRRGIEPPQLYAQGFSHANCGGACVRGGQAQWELLLRVNRPRYLAWEHDEQTIRAKLGKDVSILRDRRGGPVRPLTLADFRLRLEAQPELFDADEWGACGCTDDPTMTEEAHPVDQLNCDPESDLMRDHVGPFSREGWCDECGTAILVDLPPYAVGHRSTEAAS